MQDTTSAANLRMIAPVFEEKVYWAMLEDIVVKQVVCNVVVVHDRKK